MHQEKTEWWPNIVGRSSNRLGGKSKGVVVDVWPVGIEDVELDVCSTEAGMLCKI